MIGCFNEKWTSPIFVEVLAHLGIGTVKKHFLVFIG